MSRGIKATPGLLSITPIEENDWIGAPEGEFLVGFYLPIEELKNFRFNRECTITISEATK
jgi:hypothetical protein